MRTPRGPSRSLKSLYRTASTSDVPVVTRRHTRVGIQYPPDLLPSVTTLADHDVGLTCEPEGPCVALPVRAERAKARERLPSYREPASRNPQAVSTKTFRRSCARAPFRLLPIRAPRQAVLRTSSRLAPSHFTNRPCSLPVEKTRDVSNRCLPPKRTVCTRTLQVPGSLSRLSPRGRPTESKAPCGITGGPDVSRHPRPLRRIACEHSSRFRCLAVRKNERGCVLPTVPRRSNL